MFKKKKERPVNLYNHYRFVFTWRYFQEQNGWIINPFALFEKK